MQRPRYILSAFKKRSKAKLIFYIDMWVIMLLKCHNIYVL